MVDKARVEFDLMGRLVWFWPSGRNHSPVQGRVVQVWPGMGAVPGVNLDLKACDNPTSVPHESSVNGASGYFWSATINATGLPMESGVSE